MFGFIKRRRRKAIASEPFPDGWLELLEAGWPVYSKLPAEMQEKLRGKIQVFLAEKSFEGLQGFQVTDEVRVLIAAQACLLLLGNEQQDYRRLRSVLVHPSHYQAKSARIDEAGVVSERDNVVLGESWKHGTVTVSWEAAKHGAMKRDGQNVVIHEFAHQLDQESGAANGAPLLRSGRRYAAWGEVLSKEFEGLQDDLHRGRRTVMDGYGATNPAEFFAVASECFFEIPAKLRKRRPELYEQLSIFYGQDPVNYR